MKRIDVAYAGNSYSISGRDVTELQQQILDGIAGADRGFWLEVNHGEGQPRPTYLLITAATQVALTPIPGDEEVLPGPVES